MDILWEYIERMMSTREYYSRKTPQINQGEGCHTVEEVCLTQHQAKSLGIGWQASQPPDCPSPYPWGICTHHRKFTSSLIWITNPAHGRAEQPSITKRTAEKVSNHRYGILLFFLVRQVRDVCPDQLTKQWKFSIAVSYGHWTNQYCGQSRRGLKHKYLHK